MAGNPWAVVGQTPLPQAAAQQGAPQQASSSNPWTVVGQTPMPGAQGSGSSALDSANAYVTAIGNAIAVPGKPNWNVNNLATWADSKLPSWLGGDTTQNLNSQDAANAQNHPTATTLGGLTGAGVAGYAGGELAAPVAGVVPGTGLASNIARSAITNAAAGAAATPSNPLAGAGVGAAFGVPGGTATTLSRALAGVKNPALVAAMTKVGLTPTVAATGSPLLRALGNGLSATKDAVTDFSQHDLVRAALKPFGITNTSDLSNSTIGQAENATWNATNQLMKNTTVPLTSAPASALVNASGKPIASAAAPALQQQLTELVPSLISDPSARAALITKIGSGSLSGNDALGLFRTIRNAGASASDPFSQTSLSQVAQQLRSAIGNANPDAITSLDQSNALHQKLLVLKDVAEKANAKPGGLPTLQDFATSNKKFTPYGSVEGPYQPLVDASQAAYVPPAGSTSRYATPMAALTSKAAPWAAAALGEHLGSAFGPAGAIIGPAAGALGEHAVEKGLSKALTSALLKNPTAGGAVNQGALSKALAAAVQGGKGSAINAVVGQNDND